MVEMKMIKKKEKSKVKATTSKIPLSDSYKAFFSASLESFLKYVDSLMKFIVREKDHS